MAGETLAQARQVIEKRLTELRRETKELETALRGLGGRSRATVRSRPKQRRSRATAGRRGQRSEQFKQALAKSPGAAVSEIAKKLGISSQQGHGIAKRLRDKGEIKKQGKGYALKS
jgi:biotin operon repressor